MIWIICWTIVGPIVLYHAFKLTWRSYILWTAQDSTSPHRDLPIPPGDFGMPIIGETHLWALQGSRFNSNRRMKYGKAFSTNFIGRTMVKVTGHDYVKQILTAKHETLATIWPTTVQTILGKTAIANSVGNLHKHRRNAFLKAFTRDALNKYLPHIQETVREKMQSWCAEGCREQLVYPETKELTFNIAFRVLVGLDFKSRDEQVELFKTFDTMITNLFSLPYDLPGSGYRKALKAKKIIHGILDDHVRNLRKQVESSNCLGAPTDTDGNTSVLKIVLEAQTPHKENREQVDETCGITEGLEQLEMTDTELKETTVEMLFAGYQTTASVSTSAIINLIKFPHVFRKLEEEMRQFGLLKPTTSRDSPTGTVDSDAAAFPDEGFAYSGIRHRKSNSDTLNNNQSVGDSKITRDKNKVLTLETLSKMTYLEQFFKEILRVMPPILGGYRLALKTFRLGEYRVPKGWTIIYNIRDTHEAEWEQETEFNPDIFAPCNWKDNKESRYRWIPFGGGSRTCVGKEFARLQFKIFMIELIRHFGRLEFAKGKPPSMFAVPFLHPTDGLPVKLNRREDKKPHDDVK